MSVFHPPINTLQEWNSRMCNCCEMPLCDIPILDCESLLYVPCALIAESAGVEGWFAYKKSRLGAAFEPVRVITWTGEWVIFGEYDGCETITFEEPEPEPVNELLEPIDCDDLTANIANITHDWNYEFKGDGCMASYTCSLPESSIVNYEAFRYRWRVPPCHPGSYYKIEWDQIFFPREYLEWLDDAQDPDVVAFDPNANPPPALPVITAKSWEWTGTALGDCNSTDPLNDYDYRKDLSDRMSDWSDTVETTEEGIIEMRNVRVYCYRSTYGSKPQYVTPENAITGGSYSTGDIDQDGIPDNQEPLP
jgi:hypothetical protein